MGRMITSNIWEDDFIVSLSFFNRLVWIGLITIADDQGRMQDSANLIRSKMFPMDDVPLKDIEGALVEFCKAGKITRYIVDGKKLIQIVHWWKHQRPQWAGKSIFPAPKAWEDRIRCHVKGNSIYSLNWDNEGGYIVGYIAPYIAPEVKREVKGEGEDEGNVKGESDAGARPEISAMQEALETVTGVPITPDSAIVVDQLIAMKATIDDIQAAYNWYRGQGKQFRYYGSLVGPTKTAMTARLSKEPTNKLSAGFQRVGDD